jgi:putative ATPase
MKQPSLFDDDRPPADAEHDPSTPLAARMRPRSLDEFVGQEHLVGPGRILRRVIEADRVSSLILWGPPGTGKTTLAQIIANLTRSQFVGLSAVSAGVADLRRVIDDAARRKRERKQRTILLIDEIHRFNKAQQDSVLHAVEQGVVILVGATTENPSFEVNPALLSRCRVFTLRSLGEADITALIDRAIADADRGLGKLVVELAPDAKRALVSLADGDARTALNVLELAATSVAPDATGQRTVPLAAVEDAMQQRALRYDRAGEQHFDVISAFIKSLRGSDPDGALYWLARMLEAGEDPLFVVRRMVVLAAEDVGLADPQALVVAVAAQQAVHFVGMPEGYLPLAEAALYLATAPKSNSAIASYGRARAAVEALGNLPVPLHLRNAPTGLLKSLGYGRDYEYSHDFGPDDPRRYRQRYLPEGVSPGMYQPGAIGFEATVRERMQRIARLRGDSPPAEDHGPKGPEDRSGGERPTSR